MALSRLDLTKLPPGAVWRDYVGDIGATEGARWRWYRVGDKWRGDDHHEARWWPPGKDRPEAEVIAVLAPPALDARAVREATAAAGVARLGAEVQRWALLPEGAIVLDHAGDIAHKWDGRRWLRLAGCWQSSPVGPDSDMSDSGMAPYVVLGYAFAPTAERAADIRALVEDSDRRAASASAPAASGGDGRVRESAPVAVGDEVSSTREGWERLPIGALLRTDPACRGYCCYNLKTEADRGLWCTSAGSTAGNELRPWANRVAFRKARVVALGVSRADLTAEVARLERERRAPPAAQPSAPKVGDPVEATDEAWDALPIGALVRVPKRAGRFDFVLRVEGGGVWCNADRESAVGRPVGVDIFRDARVVALGVPRALVCARIREIEAAERSAERATALGAPVETEEAWAALPVGAVVDTRDRTGTPLAVRGPDGWGWALQSQRGGRSDEAVDWRGRRSAEHMQGFCAPRGRPRLVAKIAPGTCGTDFDRALAAQGYQPAIDAGYGTPLPPAPKPRTAAELASVARAERLAAWARLARVGQRFDRVEQVPPGCCAVDLGDRTGAVPLTLVFYPDGAVSLSGKEPRSAWSHIRGPLELLAVGLDDARCDELVRIPTITATREAAIAMGDCRKGGA